MHRPRLARGGHRVVKVFLAKSIAKVLGSVSDVSLFVYGYPMRQADIARRLANLAKARRCGAKTRVGHPCKQAAVKGRARCRMHGGAKGSGSPRGSRNGNFRYGLYTREAKVLHRALRAKKMFLMVGSFRDPRCLLFRPLSGVKQTLVCAVRMSANDPKRTLVLR
jgi:glucans biosynthesis protein